MEALAKLEIFEMKALEELKNQGLLANLVFGGGTMLRLCHQLERFSVDLDFWFLKEINRETFFKKMKRVIQSKYAITDSEPKHFTLLLEFKSAESPRKLKIEVRKKVEDFEYENQIAFSKFSTIQVLLRSLTLPQMAKNKVKALIDRKEIRDAFDLEFLIRKGVPVAIKPAQLEAVRQTIQGFRPRDFSVKLGSLLAADLRKYYNEHHFTFLLGYLKTSPNEKQTSRD